MPDCSEQSLDYAYDPRRRRQRTLWRVCVALLEGVGPALRLLSIPCFLVLATTSVRNLADVLGSFGRVGVTYVAEPGVWDALAASGLLWVLALVVGLPLITGVAAVLRGCVGDPPGSISLRSQSKAAGIVSQARDASVAARRALGRLRSADTRCRLQPHVDALDTATWIMATVMAPGTEEELTRRLRWVSQTSAELEAVVDAHDALRVLVPNMPDLAPPDPASLLEGIDPLLIAAHDDVRALHLGIEEVASGPVSPSSYDGPDAAFPKGS
jgi:hypothetical protein